MKYNDYLRLLDYRKFLQYQTVIKCDLKVLSVSIDTFRILQHLTRSKNGHTYQRNIKMLFKPSNPTTSNYDRQIRAPTATSIKSQYREIPRKLD